MATKKSLLRRMKQGEIKLFWFTDTRVVRYIGCIRNILETADGTFVTLNIIDDNNKYIKIHINDIYLNAKEACNLWISHLKKLDTPKKVSVDSLKEAFEKFTF